MNCSQARFLLYAYLDRELPRQDAEALQRHLAICGPVPPGASRPGAWASCFGPGWTTPGRRSTSGSGLTARLTARVRPTYAPLGIAASILLLILPLVSDQRGAAADAAISLATVAIGAPRNAHRPGLAQA